MRARRDDDFEADVEAMRLAYLAAHPADPITQFAAAVSAAAARPVKARHAHLEQVMRAVADGEEQLRIIAARRAEREQRNGVTARRAFAHYQATRESWLAGQQDQADDHGPSLLVAASMHQPLPPMRIY